MWVGFYWLRRGCNGELLWSFFDSQASNITVHCRVVRFPRRALRHRVPVEGSELHSSVSIFLYMYVYVSITSQQVVLYQENILSGIFFLPDYVELSFYFHIITTSNSVRSWDFLKKWHNVNIKSLSKVPRFIKIKYLENDPCTVVRGIWFGQDLTPSIPNYFLRRHITSHVSLLPYIRKYSSSAYSIQKNDLKCFSLQNENRMTKSYA